jgi:hypothetical protein
VRTRDWIELVKQGRCRTSCAGVGASDPDWNAAPVRVLRLETEYIRGRSSESLTDCRGCEYRGARIFFSHRTFAVPLHSFDCVGFSNSLGEAVVSVPPGELVAVISASEWKRGKERSLIPFSYVLYRFNLSSSLVSIIS